jgi:putative spermidine/putrescine transport system substrate-binding protein
MADRMRVLPLLALAAIAAAPAVKPDPNAPQPLSIVMAASPYRDAAKRLLLKPYADATATTLTDATWDGTTAALKTLATAHGFDLAVLDGPALTAACRAQIIDHLDWQKLNRDRFAPNSTSDCGAPVGIDAIAMAWDKDKVQGVPNWADFWDVAKRPGKRGLQRTARGTLEIALMADGVSPGDVYRTLRSNEGVDRAFRKLDQLKPYVEWWDKPGQPVQALESGKLLLTTAPAAAIGQANLTQKKHLSLQQNGSLTETLSLAVAHDAAHPAAAQAALAVASDIARQAQFAEATGLGPGITGAIGLLPAENRMLSASLPANLQAGLPIDEGFWADNLDKLQARFTAWAAK